MLEQQNNNNLLPQPHLLAPVNFRTSPPLEALKPHRSHLVQRPTTPLVLAERGIENIRISTGAVLHHPHPIGSALSSLIKCDSPSIVQQQQQQQQQNQAQPSNQLLGASTNVAVIHHHNNQFDQNRSISPPAKVFHCAVSPSRRRQSRHQTQRLQRPHRPCLDFDKMQQVNSDTLLHNFTIFSKNFCFLNFYYNRTSVFFCLFELIHYLYYNHYCYHFSMNVYQHKKENLEYL